MSDDGSDLDSLELDEGIGLFSWIPRGTDAEKWWRRFSGMRAIGWAGAIPVAIFFGWISSVAFVAVCSLYANWASDVASWRSDVNPQLDRIEKRLARIEQLLKEGSA